MENGGQELIKKRIKLLEVREIQEMATAVTMYGALGFRNDCKIKRLADEAAALIKYCIGKELEAINKKLDDRSNELHQPFQDRLLAFEGETDEEKDAFAKAINKEYSDKLSTDEEFKKLQKDELALWQQECDVEDLEYVPEIDDMPYEENFVKYKNQLPEGGDYLVRTYLYNRPNRLDGYQCLIALVAKDRIKIKTTEF